MYARIETLEINGNISIGNRISIIDFEHIYRGSENQFTYSLTFSFI